MFTAAVVLALGVGSLVGFLYPLVAGQREAPQDENRSVPAGWMILPTNPQTPLPPGWPTFVAEPTKSPQLTLTPATLVSETPSAAGVPIPATSPALQQPESAADSPELRLLTPTARAPEPPSRGHTGNAASIDQWVERELAALRTDEERIGQLLMLGWTGGTAEAARPILQEFRPGGVVFVDNARTEAAARRLNTDLRALAEEYRLLPLLIAVDHEGGEVQRIRDIPNLGSNREFANQRPSLTQACERGLRHAQQLRSMGFNMNLAPVLDVNNNPANPVIGSRSYGDDPELVASLGSAYVRGLQGGGVVAVGKHFPGHGNTAVDSHLQLPVLLHTVEELERIELVPFRRAIEPPAKLAAIMSAHIAFPAVDPSRAPATLSRPIMTELLRQRLGFQGLVLSDDLAGMRAITDNFSPGEAAVRAVEAGVDMVLISGGGASQRESRDALVAALRTGRLGRDRVEEALRHVLRVKAAFVAPTVAEPTSFACS